MGLQVGEIFFLRWGCLKDKVLKAFNAHIFFDDQDHHVGPASQLIPSGRVPYKSDSGLHQYLTEVNQEMTEQGQQHNQEYHQG